MGAEFVRYSYVLSLGYIYIQRYSRTYFIQPGQNTTSLKLKYALVSVLCGIWGFGIFLIPSTIWKCFKKGDNVTYLTLDILEEAYGEMGLIGDIRIPKQEKKKGYLATVATGKEKLVLYSIRGIAIFFALSLLFYGTLLSEQLRPCTCSILEFFSMTALIMITKPFAWILFCCLVLFIIFSVMYEKHIEENIRKDMDRYQRETYS